MTDIYTSEDGVVVITTAQLHSTKSKLRLCAGSNPPRGGLEIRDGEDLRQWSRLEIRLNAFRRSTIPQKQFIIIIILTGDFNIDLLNSFKESAKRYKDTLHMFSLQQHVNKPTGKGKALTDHICSNIPSKLIHGDVIYTDDISDHDCPYIIFNIKKDLNNVTSI